jgi:hypothetical protein
MSKPRTPRGRSLVALVDLDGTVANYTKAVIEGLDRLRGPEEEVILPAFGKEPLHIKNRINLMRKVPGWWENLEPIPFGFKIVDLLRKYGFTLHVLTKGPYKSTASWTEKVVWCRKYLPDALVTITEDKGSVYGKILVDDHIPYVEDWLEYRPRGLVIMPAHPWNEGFEHPNVIRATEENLHEVEIRIVEILNRSLAKDTDED